MERVNGIPSYHVSQTRDINGFQLRLSNGHCLLWRGPSTETHERLTKLPFMITEGTVLHDLENSPNFRDFVSCRGTEGQYVKVKAGSVVAWPSLLLNVSFLFYSLTLLIFSSNFYSFLVQYVLNCQHFHNLPLSQDLSNIFKKSYSAIIIHILLGGSYQDWIFCGVPHFLKGNSETVIENRPQLFPVVLFHNSSFPTLPLITA